MREPLSKPHVLIVEGDISIGMLIEHVLSNHGYKTTLLADGLEARNYIDEQPAPDLVLIDLASPFVPGYDLLEQIAMAGSGWEDTPVILTSMKTSESEVVRGLEAGAADFITKPFRIDELVARVRRNVRRGKPTNLFHGGDNRSIKSGYERPRLVADNTLRLSFASC